MGLGLHAKPFLKIEKIFLTETETVDLTCHAWPHSFTTRALYEEPLRTSHKGRPHLIRTERGIVPKIDIVREVAWIQDCRSVKSADGRGGSKIPKVIGYLLWIVP